MLVLDATQWAALWYIGGMISGARHEKYLWAGNVKVQIENMLYLYDSIMQKPDWLTREQILDYKKLMEG